MNMNGEKERHGCLTSWLALMIAANAIIAAIYLLGSAAVRPTVPGAPNWVIPVLAACSVLNIIFAVALLLWKRWGFFGVLGTTALTFAVNLRIGQSILQALFGLVGVAILFGVLQIGRENKGWTQLEK